MPQESFDSLLIQVRKLTMNDGPEQLHKIRKALMGQTESESNREVLAVWHKYWRLALVKEPFTVTTASGASTVMTPYRLYDSFINGEIFHSNDPVCNLVLHGCAEPGIRTPMLFLRNVFHSAVVNLCFAALGLDRFIRNNCSFENFVLGGAHPAVFDFIWWRKRVDELDGNYKLLADWIHNRDDGGRRACFWT